MIWTSETHKLTLAKNIDHIPNLGNLKYLKSNTSMQSSKQKLIVSEKSLSRKQACKEVKRNWQFQRKV